MKTEQIADLDNSFELKLPQKPNMAVVIKKEGFVIPENLILILPKTGGLFLDSIHIELINPKYREIRYTLNEDKADKTSNLYTKPILLKSDAIIKAKGYGDGNFESNDVCAEFKKTSLLKGDKDLKNLENGLKFSYFEGEWAQLPNFSKLKPEKKGIIGKFDTFPKARNENYGFVYKGFIQIEEDGIYTFYIKSNDNCQLFIDNQLVLENKESKFSYEIKNQLALGKGYHQIKLEMNHRNGPQILETSYEGIKVSKQELPGTVLFYK
jgi:hypothetical protein